MTLKVTEGHRKRSDSIGQISLPIMACSNSVSILHNFRYTTTFTVYVTACRPRVIVYQMHLIDYLITLVPVRVCVSVHRSVVERLRPQFFTDFY